MKLKSYQFKSTHLIVFKFGDGHEVISRERHRIPAFLGKKKLYIETNVVDSEIPHLLGKAAMKKGWFKVGFLS